MHLKIYKASAGSGKTHALTKQYLTMAFNSAEKFMRILAVTFTNKAAEEMKQRIISELNNIITDGEKSNHFQTLAETFKNKNIQIEALKIRDNILHNYSQFAIGTIDSFVQKVIRAFAYEINVPAGYKIEMDYDKVINDVTNILYSKINEDKELQKWLTTYATYKIEEGKSWDFREEIQSLCAEIFKERFQSFELENSRENNKTLLTQLLNEVIAIKRSFEQAMLNIAQQTTSILKKYSIDKDELGRNFTTIANYLTEKIAEKRDYQPLVTVIKAIDNMDTWHAKNASQEIKTKINLLFYDINNLLAQATTLYTDQYTNYLSACNVLANFHSFGILNDIAEVLPKYRDDNNLLLISDSTLLLKKIIDNNDSDFVYEKVGTRYQNILIDEFQDTSGFQWHNFKPLIQNTMASGNINLIVGDIKQSIYRWRGGDWKLLLSEVKNDIGETRIQEYTLDTNWRSKKNIISFNNVLFFFAAKFLQNSYNEELHSIIDNNLKNKMLEQNYDKILLNAYQDSYQFLPDETRSGGRVVVNFINCKRQEVKKQWKKQAHNSIAETIDNLLKNKDYSPKDITILVRKNREGKEIVDILMEYMKNNPSAEKYNIISSESLFINTSSSVRLLIAALKYIFDKEDSINRAILIYEYQNFNKNQITNLNQIFDTNNKTELHEFLPQEFINQYHTLRGYALYELVEVLISLFKLNEYQNEHSYLRTFQDVILDFTKKEYSDLDLFLEWWKDNGHKISVQLSDKQDAVTIMTIHKSKGLAFKIVIIPFCDWNIDHNPMLAPIIWCKPEAEPYNKFAYLPIKYKSELAKTIFQKDYFDEKLYAHMDALNMLYVALTRAEEELIIFAPTDASDKIQNVADLIYNTVNISNQDFTDNDKKYIGLKQFFSPDSFVVNINQDYTEIDTIKANKITEQNSFVITDYANCKWRDRLSIVLHAEDFFIKSIQKVKEKVDYGNLMHEIFANIIDINDIDYVMERMQIAGKIDEQDIQLLKTKIQDIFQEEIIKEWFSDKWSVVTEKEILTADGEIKIPDRILFGKDKIVVIDFKFGETNEKYTAQVHEYMKIIAELSNNKNITGYLYYANNKKAIEINF